ncbi:MAG TPA: sigma-70 family RNA polymerase sigma factor [Gemmataceae bacterium]|nr:sigma-70 family RNA polymerase sigma factor [Gemmataceae bacterium]
MSSADSRSVSGVAGRFATTHWSIVLAARDRDSPQAQDALASLCASYWYPLYAFIRRQGFTADQSQDLTQEFVARLLEKEFLGAVDREKGKFRSFLLAACKHFLANERDRERAQKRGGGRQGLSLDFNSADRRYGLEPVHTLTPERLFERRWALTLLDQVLARLRQESVEAGRQKVFDRLKVFLTGETGPAYRQVAKELGMSEGAVKVAVHRFRERYRELLREEIGRTVAATEDIDGEIRDLFAALA